MVQENRFDSLDEAIAYAQETNCDAVGYHAYAGKGGFYFVYDAARYTLTANETRQWPRVVLSDVDKRQIAAEAAERRRHG